MALDMRNQIPDWAQAYSNVIDPRTSGYFWPQDAGSGSATVGSGAGTDFYRALPDSVFDYSGYGIDQTKRINQEMLAEFMGHNQFREAYGPNDTIARWMQDPQGAVTGPVEIGSLKDRNFGIATGLAALVTGANLGAFGALGGSGAATPAGMDPSVWATMGGAPGGAASTQALTPALIESMAGTPGYGASSAGAGGSVLAGGDPGAAWFGPAGEAIVNAGQAARVPGASSLLSRGLDMALKNPQAVAALIGGVAGGLGGTPEPTGSPMGAPVAWNSALQRGIQPGTQRLASSMFKGLGIGK